MRGKGGEWKKEMRRRTGGDKMKERRMEGDEAERKTTM